MGTYLVIVNNFKRSLHHKAAFIITILLPIILCVIPGFINLGGTSLRVGLLGLENSSISAEEKTRLYTILEASEGLHYSSVDEESLHTDLITGKYQVVLNYEDRSSIDNYEFLNYQKEEKKLLLDQIFRDAISEQKPILLTGTRPKGLTVTELSFAILFSLFLIFSTVHAARIIRDRQSGILMRYQFSRKNTNGYIAGYVIYQLLITFVQILLAIGVLLVVQHNFTVSFVEGLSLSIIIAVLSTLFAMLVCLSSKSEVQANILASALAAVFSLLGGTFVAIEVMPGLLKVLSYGSPIRWIIELLRIM